MRANNALISACTVNQCPVPDKSARCQSIRPVRACLPSIRSEAPHQIRGRTHPGSSGTRLSLGKHPGRPQDVPRCANGPARIWPAGDLSQAPGDQRVNGSPSVRIPTASHAGRAANPPLEAGPKSLDGRLRESLCVDGSPGAPHRNPTSPRSGPLPQFSGVLSPREHLPGKSSNSPVHAHPTLVTGCSPYL